MKKILLIVLLSLFVTGCSGEDLHYIDPVDTTADGNVADADGAGWIPIPVTVTADGLSGMNTRFIETKNAFVFCDNRGTVRTAYISKATGTVSPLCDDPLCSHPDDGVDDMCAVVGNLFTFSTLCYSPDSGRLYFVRPYRLFGMGNDMFLVLYSVDIDKMDLTVKEHHRFAVGVRLETMQYSDGKLYFTYCDMDDEGNEILMLDAYDIKSDKVENITFFEDAGTYFTVIGDSIYYSDKSVYTLNRYCITDDKTEELIPGKPRQQYIVTEDKIYLRDTTSVSVIDTATGDRSELAVYEENTYGRAAVTAEGGVYYTLPYLAQIGDFKGGKLYVCGNGESRVYYDFGDDTYISMISAYGDNVFVEVEINDKMQFARLTEAGDKVACYFFPTL